MDKRDFLRTAGFAGLATFLPIGRLFAADSAMADPDEAPEKGGCTITPVETAGMYPLDLSANGAMFRSDIRETQQGALTLITLRFTDAENCEPIQNARVDLWHCNAFGYYSGHTSTGHAGPANYEGQTWLRGIQMTDANGEVSFLTIFPGWYAGRVTHVYYQVFLNSVVQATSQFTFPEEAKNTLYETNWPYSDYGPDPNELNTDPSFSDGSSLQTATLTYNTDEARYESELNVVVDMSSTTGILEYEPTTGGQFVLGQNYPNPVTDTTTIPFTLVTASNICLILFDMTGRKAATITENNLGAGSHELMIDFRQLGIQRTNYVYQLEVTNSLGTYKAGKMMTVL